MNDHLQVPQFEIPEKIAMVFYLSSMHSDINHSKGRHSCESRNPEKHWIPGQARNDKS